MFEIVIGMGLVFFFTWLDARSRGLTIFGNMRELPPIPNCRACGEQLPADPIFQCKLWDGTVVCEPCNDKIELEVGLQYPSWWNQSLPAEQEVAQLKAPVPTYVCAGCGFRHEELYICTETMEKFEAKPDPNHTAVGDYLPLSINFRAAGEIACSNPSMNTVVINPDMGPCLKAVASMDVKFCEHCRVDHRGHEVCTYKPAACAWCLRPIAGGASRTDGKISLCFHCIMWGRPPHPFEHVSDEELMAMFKRHESQR